MTAQIAVLAVCWGACGLLAALSWAIGTEQREDQGLRRACQAAAAGCALIGLTVFMA